MSHAFNLQIEMFLKDNGGSYVELILVVQKVMDTCDVDFGYLSLMIKSCSLSNTFFKMHCLNNTFDETGESILKAYIDLLSNSHTTNKQLTV